MGKEIVDPAAPDPEETRKATCDALKRIYLIIAGLAIAQALTRTFTDQNGFLGAKLLDSEHINQVLLVIAFLPTIVRFAHGSVMHLTAMTGANKWQWDMFGLIFQAILFFVTSLTTSDINLFLMFLVGIFILDTGWLFVLGFLGHPFRSMEHQWIASNIILCLLLGLLWCLRHYNHLSDFGIATLVTLVLWIATGLDYVLNKNEYFPRGAKPPTS